MNNKLAEMAWNQTLIENPNYATWWDVDNQFGGNINVDLDEDGSSNCAQFNCTQHKINIKFGRSARTFGDAQNEIYEMFEQLHVALNAKIGERDKIRLVFFHDQLLEGPIRFPFLSKKDFLNNNILNNFNSVIQSFREIQINPNDNFHGIALIAHLPNGSKSKKKLDFSSAQEFFNNCRSIINIKNDDNLCGVRAVIIAIAVSIKDPQLKLLLKNNSKLLDKKVLKIW